MARTSRTLSATGLLLAASLLVVSCAGGGQAEQVEAEQAEQTAPVTPTPEVTEVEEEIVLENPGLSQEELDERLRSAAWADDFEAAQQLIAWGADVNAKDGTVQSAYLIATSEGLNDLAQLALDNGADVTDLDSWHGTGLIRAAERGHWQMVGLLIQHDIDVQHMNRIGYQAIHEAVWMGRDDPMYHTTLRVLGAGGAELYTPSDREGLTPLQMAYNRGFGGQIEILEALAGDAPADPQAALMAAAKAGDANGTAVALRAGAPIDSKDEDGRSALEIAEDSGYFSTAAVLRALGAASATPLTSE